MVTQNSSTDKVYTYALIIDQLNEKWLKEPRYEKRKLLRAEIRSVFNEMLAYINSI